MLFLTVLTGVVDAVSILSLGRVFVANMTGNVVFSGFAIAGASGFSLSASLAALAGFILGAGAGGLSTRRAGRNRAGLLRNAVAMELGLMIAALVLSAIAGTPFTGPISNVLAALAAVAMGLQNAVVGKLAVPDMTTTVLTMTLTGIAADLRKPGGAPVVARRMLAVVAMLAGAIAGAVLVLDAAPSPLSAWPWASCRWWRGAQCCWPGFRHRGSSRSATQPRRGGAQRQSLKSKGCPSTLRGL